MCRSAIAIVGATIATLVVGAAGLAGPARTADGPAPAAVAGIGGPARTADAPLQAEVAPRIITGSHLDPIAIPADDEPTTVATLPVPAGRWVVIARLVADPDRDADGAVTCTLNAGATVDRATTRTKLARAATMLATADAADAWDAVVACGYDGDGAATVSRIRLLATEVAWGGEVRTATHAARVLLPRDTTANVTLDLPRGRWWILAKAVTGALDRETTVRCALTVDGAAYPDRAGQVDDTRRWSRVAWMTQTLTRLPRPGTARLACTGPRSERVGIVSDVRIVAVRVGRIDLHRQTATGIERIRAGRGAPTVHLWIRGPRLRFPKPTAERPVITATGPAGPGMTIATGEAFDEHVTRAAFTCSLRDSARVRSDQLAGTPLVANDGAGSAPMTLATGMVHDLTDVTLWCGSQGEADLAYLRWIRVLWTAGASLTEIDL